MSSKLNMAVYVVLLFNYQISTSPRCVGRITTPTHNLKEWSRFEFQMTWILKVPSVCRTFVDYSQMTERPEMSFRTNKEARHRIRPLTYARHHSIRFSNVHFSTQLRDSVERPTRSIQVWRPALWLCHWDLYSVSVTEFCQSACSSSWLTCYEGHQRVQKSYFGCSTCGTNGQNKKLQSSGLGSWRFRGAGWGIPQPQPRMGIPQAPPWNLQLPRPEDHNFITLWSIHY